MKKYGKYKVYDKGAIAALVGFVFISLIVIGGMVVLGVML